MLSRRVEHVYEEKNDLPDNRIFQESTRKEPRYGSIHHQHLLCQHALSVFSDRGKQAAEKAEPGEVDGVLC